MTLPSTVSFFLKKTVDFIFKETVDFIFKETVDFIFKETVDFILSDSQYLYSGISYVYPYKPSLVKNDCDINFFSFKPV